jgi:protein-S-isoprenylcysteine O-methyltransferase Ste14
MKKRVKIDNALLSFIIIVTGFLFVFRGFYPHSPVLDDGLDFIGFMVLLAGIMLRMSARGHKKIHSQKSEQLVTTGPYTLVRNPMYLGSFLMGAGFIFMVWPWWSLPVFAYIFYVRFNKQIVHEEKCLSELAGEKYDRYCKRVRKLFPSLRYLPKAQLGKVVNLKEAFSTHEKRGLWFWPILAVILESFQEQLVFEQTVLSQTLMVFLTAAVTFAIVFWIFYQK